jgi:hypothetical protein
MPLPPMKPWSVDWHGLIPKKCHDIVPGKNEVEPGSSQLPGSV